MTFKLLLFFLILTLPVVAQQNFTIQKIEFVGLSRLTTEEVTATTGLKVGDRFTVPALDAAAQKLMDSGLFNKVSYQTRAANQQITIIFQLEEATVTSSRVIFDNFIWFDDTQLIGAIKRELPSFTGSAPDNGDTTERIVKALQRFLHENKIEATVSHMASQDTPGSSSQEHIFTVNGVPLPICSMHFPGSSNVPEAKLIDGAKELRGAEYSRKFVSLFAANTLVSMYREVGQLKATFAPPLAKPEATANCKSGVEITVPVDEGHIYKWNRAEWSGNSAYTAPELDAVLQVKAGEVVNGVKMDQSPKEVQKLYGKKGYLLVRTQIQPEFDDQAQTVVYKMSIAEGPQFKMGKFSVKGFPESEAKSLQSQWELKPGAVYDEGYTRDFSENRMGEVLGPLFMRRHAEGRPAPAIKFLTKPDRQTLIVDVTLELTN